MFNSNRTIIANTSSVIFFNLSLLWLFSCGQITGENKGNGKTENLDRLIIYIGSYASIDEPGISTYEYYPGEGNFKKIQEVTGHVNPSFLAINSKDGYLYAVNEISGFDEANSGTVSAFSIDKDSGKLTFINRQSSSGAHPCHISVINDGTHVAVANYSGGSIALLPVAKDGSLKPVSGFVQHYGSGPDERRQAAPHAHSVYPHSEGSWIFAADLGTDMVLLYTINNHGELTAHPEHPFASMEPGAGPRHIAIHPEGEIIYVINELNSTVTRVSFDPATGQMTVGESIPTLPPLFEGENYCADIHIHPNGKFLYASNRGHNSIAIFDISGDGVPVLTGHEPVRGEWPRNFNIDPSGTLLLAANQNTDNVTVFEIDQDTGVLNFTGAVLEISNPVCIQFL